METQLLEHSQEWKRWFSKEMFQNWWRPPPLAWWTTPSGINPPFTLLDYLGVPTIAHLAFGGWTYALGWIVYGNFWEAAAWSLALALYGQVQKADALKTGYNPLGSFPVQNMVWRTLLTVVSLGVILAVIHAI